METAGGVKQTARRLLETGLINFYHHLRLLLHLIETSG